MDNAIGYQKTAMMFHMLRRELGDSPFFGAIRALIAGYSGEYADWPQVRQVFEDTSGKELSWFFKQWLHGKGTPSLRIAQAHVEPDTRTGYWVSLTVTQKGTAYRLRVPVVVQLAQGEAYRTFVDVRENEQTMALWVPAKPLRVQLDPEFETFRGLDRQAMSPMLNGWVTDQRRAVLLSSSTPESEQEGLKPALDRIRSQNDDTVWLDERTVSIGAQSVLAMGHPQTNSSWVGKILGWCGPQVRLQETGHHDSGDCIFGGTMRPCWSLAPIPTIPDTWARSSSAYPQKPCTGCPGCCFFYGWDSLSCVSRTEKSRRAARSIHQCLI